MTAAASIKATATATLLDGATTTSEPKQGVMTNGRKVSTPVQSNDSVVTLVGKTLVDADIQALNTNYKKLERVDVTGATLNGSLIVSRKAMAVLLPNHPQVYVAGIFTNIAQEIRKQLSESAQKAFDTILDRAKASFEKKFPNTVFDSSQVQSSKFVSEQSIPLAGLLIDLFEASTKEVATIQESQDVKKNILQYLSGTSFQEEMETLIKGIEPALFFEKLRSVAFLSQLLPILKKYETPLEEYMIGLEKNPKCAWFQKDVTETITKLKIYQKYLWIISLASGIISNLLWLYPAAEVVTTVERYKRLFLGILKHHLGLETVSSSSTDSKTDSKSGKREAEGAVKKSQ